MNEDFAYGVINVGGGGVSKTAVPPSPEKQVFSEINRYGYVIADVELVVEELSKRLEPLVLHFPVATAETAPDRGVQVPVAERISRETDRLAAVRERLTYLLQALEV